MPRTKYLPHKVPPELMDDDKVLQMFTDFYNVHQLVNSLEFVLLRKRLHHAGWPQHAITSTEQRAASRSNWSSNRYVTERMEGQQREVNRMMTGRGSGGGVRMQRPVKGMTKGTRVCILCDSRKLKKDLEPWGIMKISACTSCRNELDKILKMKK